MQWSGWIGYFTEKSKEELHNQANVTYSILSTKDQVGMTIGKTDIGNDIFHVKLCRYCGTIILGVFRDNSFGYSGCT